MHWESYDKDIGQLLLEISNKGHYIQTPLGQSQKEESDKIRTWTTIDGTNKFLFLKDRRTYYYFLGMLSHQELRNIRRQLENNPSKNLRKKLKKKLKEHEYASTYRPFTPLSHQRHFINQKTEEQTLIELTRVATDSTIFLLDTESVLVRHQPNRPGLIQLEIIPSDTLPVVLIIEVNHLPPTHSHAFQLIRQLFRIVLDPENVIYTWGIIAELKEFVQFNLFNHQQIESCDNRNLQDIFKQYWQQGHEHKRKDDCKCEECIGKNGNEQWSLQDAVAYQLEEWLDKRQTCSPFDMGLDPRLNRSQQKATERQTILADYAANDCLSMEKLMISIQEHPPPKLDRISIGQDKSTNAIDEQIENQRNSFNQSMYLDSSASNSIDQSIQHRQREQQQRREIHREEEPRSESSIRKRQRSEDLFESKFEDDDRIKRRKSEHLEQYDQSPALDERKEEKKSRNRRSTLKQRKRQYKHEIIRRGIDPRFSITMVKEILRRYEIYYTAVNISKSSVTGRTSLYIGIKDQRKLHEYINQTKSLFTTDCYNEFRARRHLR